MSAFLISYAPQDLQWAIWIAEQLQQQGLKAILRTCISTAQPYEERHQQEAFSTVGRMVVVLSPYYLACTGWQAACESYCGQGSHGGTHRLIVVKVASCDADSIMGEPVALDLTKFKDNRDNRAALELWRIVGANASGALFGSSGIYPGAYVPNPPINLDRLRDYVPPYQQPFGRPDSPTESMDEILSEWLSPDVTTPLVLVTHFDPDARDLLSYVVRWLQDELDAPWRPAGIQWISTDRVRKVSHHFWARTTDPEQKNMKGGIAFALLQSPQLAASESSALFERYESQDPSLFLVDLTGGDPARLLEQLLTGQDEDLADKLANAVADFANWATAYGHRAVVALPHYGLAVAAMAAFVGSNATSYAQAALFEPTAGDEEDRSEDKPAGLTEWAQDRILHSFLRTSSPSLRHVMRGVLEARQHQTHRPNNEWDLAALAESLWNDGFFEPAFRIELYIRSVDTIRNTIPLSGDLDQVGVTDYARQHKVFAFVEDVAEAPAFFSHGFISGEAGIGKTTAMLQIESTWALPYIRSKGKLCPTWLPVRIPLDPQQRTAHSPNQEVDLDRALSDYLARAAANYIPGTTQPRQLAAHTALARFGSLRAIRRFASSPVLLLLDEVDRIPEDQEYQLGLAIEALLREESPPGLLAASRRSSVPGLFAGYRLQLRSLNEQQVQALIRLTTRADPLRESKRLFDITNKPIANAIRNPFLLTCISRLIEALPGTNVVSWNRYDILHEYITYQARRTYQGAGQLVDDWLPALAFDLRFPEATSGPPNVSPDLLDQAREMGFLTGRPGLASIEFRHGLLRDYFAAVEVERRMREEGVSVLDTYLPTRISSWPSYADFLQFLVSRADDETAQKIIARVAEKDIDLALQCLLELTARSSFPHELCRDVTSRIITQIQPSYNTDSSVAIHADRQSVHAIEQTAARASALSFLDPRIRLDTPGDMLQDVPTVAPLSPFAIGRYPVTNLEFASFVNDGGYENKEWWIAPAWEWRKTEDVRGPRFWHNDRFNRSNYPVVGVSLFEAHAYCRWLTARLDQVGSGIMIHLPTENQWNRAAVFYLFRLSVLEAFAVHDSATDSAEEQEHSLEGTILAKFTAALHPHLTQLRHGETTPIGIFPPNALGCYDVLGNVWEWCDGWHGEITPEETARMRQPGLVKGGPSTSTFSDPLSILGEWFDPFVRFPSIGFRICHTLP